MKKKQQKFSLDAFVFYGNRRIKAIVYLNLEGNRLTALAKSLFPDSEIDHKKSLRLIYERGGVEASSKYSAEVDNAANLLMQAQALNVLDEMAKERKKRVIDDIFGESPVEQSIDQNEKGKRNERALARWFKAWTNDEAEFIRTPSSGGRRIGAHMAFVGDIVCKDPKFDFPFVVETKHWKKAVLSKKAGEGKELRQNSVFLTVWKQVKNDVERTGNTKAGLTFIRENNMPDATWYVSMPAYLAAWIQTTFKVETQAFSENNGDPIVVFLSDDLLRVNFSEFALFTNFSYLSGQITQPSPPTSTLP